MSECKTTQLSKGDFVSVSRDGEGWGGMSRWSWLVESYVGEVWTGDLYSRDAYRNGPGSEHFNLFHPTMMEWCHLSGGELAEASGLKIKEWR